MAEAVTIYTDGGSRGNPGPAAAAFVLLDENGNQFYAKAEFLGPATNNIAEYAALKTALEKTKALGIKNITIYSDSELMVRQINGRYKVKSDNIKELYNQCVKRLAEFNNWTIEHTRRHNNQQADKLVNQALDAKSDIELGYGYKSSSTVNKNTKPLKLGILLSGGGRTMMNILEQIENGMLNAEIKLVISSRANALGVEKAQKAGLNVKIIRKKDCSDIDEFSEQIKKELLKAKIELVVQGGWLCLWKIPPEYDSRVMNIHPALLPSFGGQGMWGHHVHEAVLAAGCKVSGCTVHFCTNEYDKGPVIIQRCCPVKDNDDVDSLAERVFAQECIAYPEAIRLFAEKK